MKKAIGVSISICLILMTVIVVWALPTGGTIDGNPGDWSDATCIVDDGGVDDEASPTRADITEFCAHVDSSYIYVLMAWDHTGFTGGNASTAGTRLDITGDGAFDFIILGSLQSDPPTISSYSVGSCPGGACTNADDICSSTGGGGGLCTGALSGVGVTWDDPFDPTPGHGGGNVCGGANCTTQDAFLELAIPWSLLSLPGPPNPHVFGDFGSYPSGPAQAPKDTVNSNNNGIICLPDGTCYSSTPTAITVNMLEASSFNEFIFVGIGLGVAILAIASIVVVVMHRRFRYLSL